jgi:hypothetical protein
VRSLSDAQASGELGVDEELEIEEGAESSRSSLRLDSLAGADAHALFRSSGRFTRCESGCRRSSATRCGLGAPSPLQGALFCV